MVDGIVKNKPLRPKAKKLLKKLQGELKKLNIQMRTLQKQAHERECVAEWLVSPWDYGDIVEEIVRASPIRRDRAARKYVVVRVSTFRVMGRLLKKDGTLGKSDCDIFNHYKDEPIGRYTGSDLPKPPPGAVEAMEAKGTL